MIQNWQGTHVVIIGAARQGLALARYLATRGAVVTVTDSKPSADLAPAMQSLNDLPVSWVVGGHPSSVLDDAQLLCTSGGVSLDLPIVQEAARRGIPLSNDTQIFLQTVPCPVVGITGSAGKTTTTTLVGRMALAAAEATDKPAHAWVGGNIGNPLINEVDEMSPSDLVVLELSSFQLELTTLSPQVAAVLNITPNHLDRHMTMEAYTAAKARILDYQDAAGTAILNREDPGSWGLAGRVHGKILTFGLQKPAAPVEGSYFDGMQVYLQVQQKLMPILKETEISLRGKHNLQNILAAVSIAAAAGLPVEAMRSGIIGFNGVPHRLEFVRKVNGAAWYNDSIATAPERAIADIHSFDEPLILLAGGRDKNLPWEEWSALVRQRVDHLFLFGEAAPLILSALQKHPGIRPYTIQSFPTLQEAVHAASQAAAPGDVVLLAPGGTSFDEFRDFEERGERFREWVNKLT